MFKNIIISILLIALVYTGLILRLRTYGIDYNLNRIKNHIPVVSKDWNTNYNVFNAQLSYLNKSIFKRKRLKKTIEINYLYGIIQEYDYYLIEDQKISIDAIYRYYAKKAWCIRYYNRGGQVNELTRQQLSDTLSKYGVSD